MQEKIDQFKNHVRKAAANPQFVHYNWFVKWHLEIVERLSEELLEKYPQADRHVVNVLVWLHDYGKILDFDNQYEMTLTSGKNKLTELGLAPDFVNKILKYAEVLDKKLEVDLRSAPIEVQIVSSADGCSHFVGPFMSIFWHEATDMTFAGKTYEELMQLNLKKAEKDWQRKITLPEARQAFEPYYQFVRQQAGDLPKKFFS